MSPYDDVANDYKCSLFKLDDLKKKKKYTSMAR